MKPRSATAQAGTALGITGATGAAHPAPMPGESPGAGALATVEAAVEERVLVYGSLPPQGRDIDLLVRPSEERSLTEALPRAGFVRRGHEWARFRDCSVELIDLSPASTWRLPSSELEALFAEARPLEDGSKVVRPSSHHMLLILARRTSRNGHLDERHRARLADALAERAETWEEAARRAPAWAAESALAALESAYAGASKPPAPERAATRTFLSRDARRLVRRGKAALGRPRRAVVVTFSGLDGSGKSSQAAALRDTLERLGYDAVVEWKPVDHHPVWFKHLRRAIDRSLRLLVRIRGRGSTTRSFPEDAGGEGDLAGALRRRSPLAALGWTSLLAAANGVAQARATWPNLLRGRVVIADRYTLDTKVHLRYFFGQSRTFRFETGLIRVLSRRPRRAYFLEVAPETSCRRKSDYGLEETVLRAELYREELAAFSLRRLDGERPRDELCAEIAEDVWRALP